MNYDQIKNGEERIFPFYKGKYMGKTEMGFSNRSSAQKFMNDIPDKDVYDRLGGKDEYIRTHEFLYGLDKKKNSRGYYNLYMFNPPKGGTIYSKRRYDDIYNRDDAKYYIKDMPEDMQVEIRKIIDELGFLSDCNEPTKLDIIREFMKKWELFPSIFIDEADFEKMHRKMMKEDIEYRTGIVHITIEYTDERN